MNRRQDEAKAEMRWRVTRALFLLGVGGVFGGGTWLLGFPWQAAGFMSLGGSLLGTLFVLCGPLRRRQMSCPSDQWTTVLRDASPFSGEWKIRFTAREGGAVEGEVEETWTGKGAVPSRLRSEMEFKTGFGNQFYTVRVRPQQDVHAEIL